MNTGNSEKRQQDLMSEYLGPSASAGGPFAVLDLRHDQATEQGILRACQSRLAQISRHMRSRTPEADEVRLAVHAAASQLLDSSLCDELKKVWPEGSGMILESSTTPQAWKVDDSIQIEPELLEKARWMLAASGGWNGKSRKRLGFFARSHEVPAARLIRDLLGDQAGEMHSRPMNDVFTRPAQYVVGLVPNSVPWFMFPVLYGVLSLLLITVGFYRLASPQLATDHAYPIDQTASQGSPPPVAERQVKTQDQADRQHYSAILHELESYRGVIFTDEDQARSFSELGARLVQQWRSFSATELESSMDLIRETLSGVLNEDYFMLASSFLTRSDQDQLVPISALVLKKMLFGSIYASPNYGALYVGYSSSLKDAFKYTLQTVAEQSRDDPGWWQWWEEQVQARPVLEWEIGNDPWLTACRARLLDSSRSEQWELCARIFVRGVNWGDDSQAKVWYMAQVVDDSVSSNRLAVLSEAVALYSSAGGLDTQTLIGVDADMSDREAYLGELRNRWGSQGDDPSIDTLIKQLRSLISITDGSINEDQVLIRSIELARINTACWARERGDHSSVGMLEQSFNARIEQPEAEPGQFNPSSNQEDDQWADDARNTSDPESLLELLRDLDRQGKVQPKSAHALVWLAMQAPDLGVRDFAERVLLQHRDEINILIALDRVAGDERVSRRMLGLIQACLDDSSGNINIRQKLLERILDLGIFTSNTSGHPYSAFVDEYCKLLAIRIGQDGQARTRDAYQFMLRELFENNLEVPRSVQSTLALGLKRSSGAVQHDVIYMNSVLVMFSRLLSDENSAIDSQIDVIMRDHSARIANARSVYKQFMATERTIARLWLLKLESELLS